VATYVLVHGAWHGGWCWQRVTSRLRAAGHEVLTPTLTGLGDRSHLLTPEIGLHSHVDDLVATLEFEDVRDVVLVGHSYAGLVISGAAGLVRDRLRQLVYLDAFLPDEGDYALKLLPPEIADAMRRLAAEDGDGWKIPPRSLKALGVVDEEAEQWLKRRLVPHPFRSYEEPVHLTGDLAAMPAAFVLCTGWAAVFRPQAAKARALGWPVLELERDHEAFATAPDELAEILVSAVAAVDNRGRDGAGAPRDGSAGG
jgi:pimeloyl-ACP methyl ester carboxylesterase